MRASRVKTLIIGLLLLALGGCSATRIAYNNGPTLVGWWLDDRLDLDRGQEAKLRVAVEDWFGWHRTTQLPEYADALARLGARAGSSVSAGEVCAWTDEWRSRLTLAAERALPAAARLLPEVGGAQWEHLARRNAEKNAELRAEVAPEDAGERATAAWNRALERFESLYGGIEDAQRRVLKAGLAESPFDPGRWMAEREARQREQIEALKAAQGEGLSRERRIQILRQLVDRLGQSSDPAYRAYQAKWTAFNCRLAAQLHNAASPRQREHLRHKLAGWEADARALAAQADLARSP